MSSRVFLRALCAASIIVVSPALAVAAEPSPSPSPAITEIGTVQTGARATETLRNATKSVYVVSKAEILRHGYRSVAEALQSVPGVNVSAYGATGALAGVSIRGSSSVQVLVLIDGIPAGGAQTGSVDLASISTSGVDRIEVVQGGGSTLYGAGSIGGIVNVITHPLAGGSILTARLASFGERSVRVETKNVSFERTVANNAYPYPGGTRSDSDSEMTSARFTFAGDAGKLGFDFSGGISAHNLGTPGPVPATFATPARQRSVDRDVRAGLTANHPHAQTVLELGATSQELLYTCNDPGDPNCFSPLGALTLDNRVQASLRNTVTHSNARTTYGVDFARGTARIDDGAGSITTSPYSQSALYGQQTWITPAGSRYYLGVRGERDGAQGGVVAPSLGFLQHLWKPVVLRGNYATAFRAPNAVELYYPFYGTPALRPERARVADLTLENPELLGGASLTWFGEWAHDLIVSDPVTFTARNIGIASIAGFTAEIRTRPYHHYVNRLSVTDLYRALDLTPGGSNFDGRIFGAGPVFQVSDEFEYLSVPGAFLESAGITAHSKGRQVSFGIAPAYTRIDAFARFRVGAGALLTLRGYNLGNEAIQGEPGFPSPGRAFSVELSTR